MKLTAYDEEFHLELTGAGGVVAYHEATSHTALGSNSPVVNGGSGSTGSGPQAAAWDHRHPAAMLFLDHGNAGTTETIDLGDAEVHRLTLNANCTLTLTGATALIGSDTVSWGVVVELVQDGTGGRTVTWPGSVDFGTADDQPDTTASTMTVFVLQTDDGGTTWQGYPIGGAGGSGTTSPLTTKGDLYVYSTTDARLGVGTDYAGLIADSAEAAGVRWTYAPVSGELLVADTPAGSPLVFDDLIQNDTGTDMIYADL